jgi:hypothetical protein
MRFQQRADIDAPLRFVAQTLELLPKAFDLAGCDKAEMAALDRAFRQAGQITEHLKTRFAFERAAEQLEQLFCAAV